MPKVARSGLPADIYSVQLIVPVLVEARGVDEQAREANAREQAMNQGRRWFGPKVHLSTGGAITLEENNRRGAKAI